MPASPVLGQGDSTEIGDGRFSVVSEPQFRLMERISFPGELIRSAAWLDSRRYLCLTAGPPGAQVWTVNYESGERSLYISTPFFNEHIATFPECLNLSWSLSPSRRYMFLYWPDASGSPQWRLLDISDPPFFVSKSFTPPGGMRIHDILFSEDDHYAVFSNDSWSEGSEISLLMLDLANGSEAWRLSTHDLSFVRRIWWEQQDSQRYCMASAELQDGEFRQLPGLARISINEQTIEFEEARQGLLMADQAAWGKVECFQSNEKKDIPYFLRADIPGHGSNMQVPLSDEPLDLVCMDEPGLLLLRNTVNHSISQLWLINLLSGDKIVVSSDCERFELGENGRLLIVPRGSNELQVMQLFLPDQA